MTDETSGGATLPVAADLRLEDVVVDLLRARLPAVAEHTVAAITVEVPSYAHALTGSMGQNIRRAVELALGGFLSLAARPRGSDPGTPLAPAREGAYALGRGEARSGRSMDALLAAYRVGARVSWRELSATAVEARLSPDTFNAGRPACKAVVASLAARAEVCPYAGLHDALSESAPSGLLPQVKCHRSTVDDPLRLDRRIGQGHWGLPLHGRRRGRSAPQLRPTATVD